MRRQRYESYQEYLASVEWAVIRERILTLDDYKCRDCGQPATEVHHLRYPAMWGTETDDMLISLCRKHHRERHPEKQTPMAQIDKELSEYLNSL